MKEIAKLVLVFVLSMLGAVMCLQLSDDMIFEGNSFFFLFAILAFVICRYVIKTPKDYIAKLKDHKVRSALILSLGYLFMQVAIISQHVASKSIIGLLVICWIIDTVKLTRHRKHKSATEAAPECKLA